MSYNHNPGTDTISNVKCSAKKCVYHGVNDICNAGNIKVANEEANSKTETFCSTYMMQ